LALSLLLSLLMALDWGNFLVSPPNALPSSESFLSLLDKTAKVFFFVFLLFDPIGLPLPYFTGAEGVLALS